MRSSAAVPPEQVTRSRSISKSSLVISRSRPVAAQEPGAGQQIGAGRHCPKGTAAARQTAERAQDLPILVAMGIDAGDDDQLGQARHPVQAGVGHHLDVAGGHHGPAVLGDQLPLVEPPAGQAVGRAQGLHRRGEPEHGELGDQQEPEDLGRFV
jgi:hypothetical protein